MGQRPSAEHLFSGGGEMGGLICSRNWAETAFGPVEHWPESLRSALGICLGARFPIAIYWGPDRLLLYNDAWRPIVGNKHPWALGRPAQEVWPEIWDDIGPEFDAVFATGEGIFHSDELLAMHRYGYTEECFFDYTFNPIQGVSGRVEGIFNVGSETTYRVLGDRRAGLLRELATCTGLAKTVDEAGALIAAALRSDPADIPLALLYTLGDGGKTARLHAGLAGAGEPFAPTQLSLEAARDSGWPIAPVAQTAQAQILDNLEQRFGVLPGSPWPEPPQEAMVLPVAVAGQSAVAAVLVLVASPRRRLDAAYRDFFEQVTAQVAAAIANAQAQEEDRRQTEQLAEQKHLLELIASGQPLDESLAAVCASVSRLNPHIRACFLLVDEHRQRFIRAVAPDFSEDFRAALVGIPISTIPMGTCAEAVSCGEPITCVDVVNDGCWSPAWRDLCLAHAIRACHSTPVLDAAGLPLGSLMLCFDRPQAPTPWEYQLTTFGTQLARIAFERDRTTLALRASEHRYRTLFESMNQGFCLCELLLDDSGIPVDYRFLEANPAFESLTGLRQIAGQTARDLTGDLDPFWLETYGHVAVGREACQFERELALPGRWFSIYTFPIGPAQGRRFAILLTDISDRRRLEQDRERFLAVGSDLLVITGIDGYFQWVSPTFERVLGWTATDMMARPWIEFVHPDDRAATQREANAIVEDRATFSFENRYRHRDGTYRWFLWNVQTYPDTQVLYGAAVDITNLKQAEETLRQRETELRLVTDAVPALISFVDADQRYRFNNRGYEEWFGRRAADLYGQRLRDVLGEAAYDNICPYVEQVLAGQKTTFDTQLAYRDGGSRYVSATYVPRFNDQGAVEGFVALINDISDRRQAAAALIHSEERYRYLAESIPQLVWTANAEGMLLDTNQRWCSFTGLSLEQVKVAGWQAVVHPDDLATLSHNWAKAQQAGNSYQAEGRMRRADGVYRWHLHQAVPVKDSRGQVTRWFGTATDIEDQKQLEQQRSQLLCQEQAARAAAEAASRTKDEFLAVVSHELRSPLNPILGWATLLKNGGLSEAKTQQALAVIERNAKLQTELIDDLLDVSRMLRGKLQISASPVNLGTVIRAAIETVRLSAAAKGIQLETHLEPGVGLASGDATRLQQVVWNLLSNAVKFTPAAGHIAVSLGQAGAGQARIVVTDTGKGITPEFLPMIFDYFRQADSATTRQFGGLGLGLAIVRHLVELHGGTIQASSPGEGGGATFTVSLPTLAESPAATPDKPLRQPALELPGTQVLVVDDDSDTRTFMTFLLEQAGAQVISAASAQECLKALGKTHPQVIVSDIGMPDMDGYMMMRQIRALPADRGGAIPAIALTAYVREADQVQSLAAGFQRHIAKPVEPAALLRAIAELLTP